MSTKHDELIDWLRDAYGMERGLETTLLKQAENDEFPESVRTQARQHCEETRAHAEAIEACLKSLGTDTSAVKTGLGKMMESVKGFGTTFSTDERVKDLLVGYASEHFEIACYRALRVAAQTAGEPVIAAVCDRILPDEERMAAWIDRNLPSLVSEYMQETAAA